MTNLNVNKNYTTAAEQIKAIKRKMEPYDKSKS